MKKRTAMLLGAFAAFTIAAAPVAGVMDEYYEEANPDGTYTYYFDQRVAVTVGEDWYQGTLLITDDSGATFYEKESYEKYAQDGIDGGGRLFTLGASVNTDFERYPSFRYIGFDEETVMNYFVVLPTDYQAYTEDDATEKYNALWAQVDDIIAGITLNGNKAEGTQTPLSEPSGDPEKEDDMDAEVSPQEDSEEESSGEAEPEVSESLEEAEPEISEPLEEAEPEVSEPIEEAEPAEEQEKKPDHALMGGWQLTEDAKVTQEAQEAFEKAVSGSSEGEEEYEPIALLATQIVSGTNYCLLCRTNPVDEGSVSSYILLYLYEDLNGNAQILQIQEMVFGLLPEEEEPFEEPGTENAYAEIPVEVGMTPYVQGAVPEGAGLPEGAPAVPFGAEPMPQNVDGGMNHAVA